MHASKVSEEDDALERPQDPLVASVMEEDQARKKQKKGPQATGKRFCWSLRAECLSCILTERMLSHTEAGFRPAGLSRNFSFKSAR